MPVNINRVTVIGNLTRDPELRATPSGMSVCSLRIAVNTRRKDPSTGEWGDKPNFFNVTVWGTQADNCNRFLAKGRQVGIDGRLEWREWTNNEGQKRQAVDIVAESVQFLGGGDRDSNGHAPSGGYGGPPAMHEGTGAAAGAPPSDATPESAESTYGGPQQSPPPPTTPADDDIPF